MNTARIEGRVKFINQEKGFGFIRNPIPPAPGEKNDIFLHVTEIPPGVTLNPGDVVAFSTKQTRKGTVATGVELIRRAEAAPRKDSYAQPEL